jgi:pre-mRNA-splicing factor CWC26
MSGPKAEAILSRSTDPTIKKRKKKPKNEDYVTKLEAGEGLKLRDEDEWKHGEDVEMVDGEDAPSTSLFYWVVSEKMRS